MPKSEIVTEVLSQAAKGVIPKLLHVDFNWELNPAKAEPQSDDDIIDDSSFRYLQSYLRLLGKLILIHVSVLVTLQTGLRQKHNMRNQAQTRTFWIQVQMTTSTYPG